MSALIRKELRLVAPGFGGALALAILAGSAHRNDMEVALWLLLPLWAGMVLVPISSFGSEFSSGTFALLLSQPVGRRKVWWTKFTIALTALAILETIAYYLFQSSEFHFLANAAFVLAAMSTAFWTTLLIRQNIASFTIALFLPAVLQIVCAATHLSGLVSSLVMLGYAIAGIILAYRLFLTARDVGWTGGEVALPSIFNRAHQAGTTAALNSRGAMLRKDLKLLQPALVAMAILLVLHLIVIFVRKSAIQTGSRGFIAGALQIFAGFWLLAPLGLGAIMIAEERKLGVLPQLLCLPAKHSAQIARKLVLTLLTGGLIAPFLLCVVESIGTSIGARSGINFFETPFSPESLGILTVVFTALSLIGFYASSVSRNFIQALAIGAGISTGLLILDNALFSSGEIFGYHLWAGLLIYHLAWPALAVAFVWLAFRNFNFVSLPGNVRVLTGTLLLAIVATSLLYNRFWELLMPTDPLHGPPRILASQPISLRQYNLGLATILPDGRGWVSRINYHPGRRILAFGDEHGGLDYETGILIGPEWRHVVPSRFEPGTNWKDLRADYNRTVGIQSNGTLWISERLEPGGSKGARKSQPQMTQFGTSTNWSLVLSGWGGILFLQKTDGSIWKWGDDNWNSKIPWPGLASMMPERLSSDTFTRVTPFFDHGSAGYGWKSDGTAWSLIFRITNKPGQASVVDLLAHPIPILDKCEFSSIVVAPSSPDIFSQFRIGVRTDGTLWWWKIRTKAGADFAGDEALGDPTQLGTDSHWQELAGLDFSNLYALKADGTLWRWIRAGEAIAGRVPQRVGRNRDWIGVTWDYDGSGGGYGLAADGSLWFWWDQGQRGFLPQPLLAPPRRPSLVENIFVSAK